MPAVSYPRICVLFALPEETAPFLRGHLFDPHNAGNADKRGQTWHAVLPTPALTLDVSLACSGTGARAAARCAESLFDLDKLPPRCLLICGFAGGLQPNLIPGTLLLADRVIDEAGSSVSVPDAALFHAAETLTLPATPMRCGTLLTVDRVAVLSEQKRTLAAHTGAAAIDMETLGAAQAARKRGVPWLAARAVTDGVMEDLPFDFNALADEDGNVQRGRVVAAALTHPWKIPALIRLGSRSSTAARALAAFLNALLPALPKEIL